jgi:hypothetical protein
MIPVRLQDRIGRDFSINVLDALSHEQGAIVLLR